VIAVETDRDSRQRAPERQVERHDAMARVAWIEGYLSGMGKAKVARALARKRSLENIQHRRAAHDVARALDRNRKRVLDNMR
jgi:adenylylsulfate kinase-like enzyme